MKNLHSEISKQEEQPTTGSKRNVSESEPDTELSSKKITRTDDNTSNSSDPSEKITRTEDNTSNSSDPSQSDAGSF
jgi:hypothetical protein